MMCRALAQRRQHFKVVACVHTQEEVLKQVSEHHPQVALIGPLDEGSDYAEFKVIRKLRALDAATRVIALLECSDSRLVFDAFSAGAKGVVCLTHSFESMCKAIKCVHAGQIWADSGQLQGVFETLAEGKTARVVNAKGMPLLTKREEQITQLVAEGLPNNEICANLGVSTHTVKNHLFRIYEKLGISSRVELVLYALSNHEER